MPIHVEKHDNPVRQLNGMNRDGEMMHGVCAFEKGITKRPRLFCERHRNIHKIVSAIEPDFIVCGIRRRDMNDLIRENPSISKRCLAK